VFLASTRSTQIIKS